MFMWRRIGASAVWHLRKRLFCLRQRLVFAEYRLKIQNIDVRAIRFLIVKNINITDQGLTGQTHSPETFVLLITLRTHINLIQLPAKCG